MKRKPNCERFLRVDYKDNPVFIKFEYITCIMASKSRKEIIIWFAGEGSKYSTPVSEKECSDIKKWVRSHTVYL